MAMERQCLDMLNDATVSRRLGVNARRGVEAK